MRITKILVTHDLPFVFENCDRVVIMSGGKIAADGDSFAILSDEALLSEYGLELPYGFYPVRREDASEQRDREGER
jgi:cobalt/nickel transport system ATP-binding protein